MQQRDYILRMIEQSARMLRQIIFLRKNGQLEQAMELLTQAMKQLSGLNAKLVERLPVDELLVLLSPRGYVDASQSIMAAQLMLEQANVIEAQQSPHAEPLRLKALELLLKAREQNEASVYEEAFRQEIEGAADLVKGQAKSETIVSRLVKFYDDHGMFAKAEDELFHWMDCGLPEAEGRISLLDGAEDMYKHWLELPEEKLLEGRMTALEAKQGLSEIQRYREQFSL